MKREQIISEKQIFLKECKEVRNYFVKIVSQYTVNKHLRLRTETDTLLIMYDQLCERLMSIDSIEEAQELLSDTTCPEIKPLKP